MPCVTASCNLTTTTFVTFAFSTGAVVFQTITTIAFSAIAIGAFTCIHIF